MATIRIAARGVYYLPWHGPNGEIYLVGVDRFGKRAVESTVEPGWNLRDAERAAREALDEQDPPVRLVS